MNTDFKVQEFYNQGFPFVKMLHFQLVQNVDLLDECFFYIKCLQTRPTDNRKALFWLLTYNNDRKITVINKKLLETII